MKSIFSKSSTFLTTSTFLATSTFSTTSTLNRGFSQFVWAAIVVEVNCRLRRQWKGSIKGDPCASSRNIVMQSGTNKAMKVCSVGRRDCEVWHPAWCSGVRIVKWTWVMYIKQAFRNGPDHWVVKLWCRSVVWRSGMLTRSLNDQIDWKDISASFIPTTWREGEETTAVFKNQRGLTGDSAIVSRHPLPLTVG